MNNIVCILETMVNEKNLEALLSERSRWVSNVHAHLRQDRKFPDGHRKKPLSHHLWGGGLKESSRGRFN